MNKLYGILVLLTVAAVSQAAVTTMPSPAISFSPSATPVDLTDWYLGEKSILFVHYSYGGHPDDVDMKGPPGSVTSLYIALATGVAPGKPWISS